MFRQNNRKQNKIFITNQEISNLEIPPNSQFITSVNLSHLHSLMIGPYSSNFTVREAQLKDLKDLKEQNRRKCY